VFAFQYRKGWDILLRAWWAAFTSADDVALVLKINANYTIESEQWIISQLQEFEARNCIRGQKDEMMQDTAPIHIILERLSPWQMDYLYQSCDTFVLPSRGEAWGRPYAEALYRGKNVIAPCLSGEREMFEVAGYEEGVGGWWDISSNFSPCMNMVSNLHVHEGKMKPNFPVTSMWTEPHIDDLVAAFREMKDISISDDTPRYGTDVMHLLSRDRFAEDINHFLAGFENA
jgi:hypothetical protein